MLKPSRGLSSYEELHDVALPSSDAASLDAAPRRASAAPRAAIAASSTKHKSQSSVQDALLSPRNVMQIDAATPRELEAPPARMLSVQCQQHITTHPAAGSHHAIVGWRRVYFVGMYCATIALLYADQNLLAPTMTGLQST